MAAYEASMKRWPVPYEQMDITGGYGGTHLVTAGPKDAPAHSAGTKNALTIAK